MIAVIGVNFTGQEISEGMTEVMAYGTSVSLVPLQQQPQQPQFPAQPAYSPQAYAPSTVKV